MTSKAIPESEILAPRDPFLDHRSDDWPEFELKDVRVHLPEDPSQLASLLEAAAHYPLTVTGHLEPLSNAQAHLQLPTTTQRRPLIEISEVRMFSYGQFEDGNIGLWAGGKAGWFALKPARAYRSIWTGMVESVNTLYWVADAYREKRKRGDWKTAPLLPDYTPEELFQKYAEEVIEDSHGAKEAAQVIHEQKDFLLASMLAGKEGIVWLKNPLYIYLSQRFSEEHALIRGRLTGTPVPARGARQTSVTSQNSNLKRKRGRPRKHQSEEVCSVRESSVAELPAKGAARSKREASHQESARPHGARRTRRGRTESSEAETPEVEVSTPSIAHSDDDDTPQRSMKGRSALRPKASKASKGASKGGKAPVMNFMDDDDEDDNESSPVAAKRRNSRSGGRNYLSHRSSKLDVDEGIDIPSSPSGSDHQSPLSDTGAGANEEGLSSDLALRLKHEPDPIQEDTWVCALDGCSHKVYQASAEDSQRLIREHYALHAYDDDARVQLVKKLQHPSLPVGHLMERVRLQARTEGFPSSSSALEGANAHSRYRPLPQVRY